MVVGNGHVALWEGDPIVPRSVALLVAVVLLFSPLAQIDLGPDLEEGPRATTQRELQMDPALPLDATLPLSGPGEFFTENLGQLGDTDVRFYVRGDPLSVAFGTDAIMYSYRGPDASFAFSMQFQGSKAMEPIGTGDLDRSSSFFLGRDPRGWVSNARSFREVHYEEVYEGVDLRFYFKDGLLKYDLSFKAYANVGTVSLGYAGLDGIDVDPGTGDLLLRSGPVTLRDKRPVIVQDGLGIEGSGPGDFVVSGDSSVTFRLPGGLDMSRPFVIDPGIKYSTLIGGNLTEMMTCVEVAPDGDIVMAGYVDELDFPITPGTYRTPENLSKGQNLVVTKMDPTLSQMVFSTVIGGSKDDWAQDLDVAADGTIYLVGTGNDDFPITADAFDKDNGNGDDAVLVVLSADGTDLLYSGFIGGSEMEMGLDIHLYSDGSVLVLGSTNSSDLYTTPGAFCETYVRTFPMNDPYIDSLFIAKVRPSLDRLHFLTYINGFSTSSIEAGLASVAVDNSGAIFLALTTDWKDFPAKPGDLDPTFNGGTDCGIMKFNPTCSNLVHSTFLGGADVDAPSDIILDSQGRPWIVGATHSGDFPNTTDAYQVGLSASGNGFLTVLESDLSAINYSTFFGGSLYTSFDSIRLDEGAGRYYTVGGTSAMDLPVTNGCFNPVYLGGGDPYAAVFNATSHALEYCSYMGGSDSEGLHPGSLDLDGQGNMVVAGLTRSNDFPTSSNAQSALRAGVQDAFALVLDPTPLTVPDPPSSVTLVGGDGEVNVSWEPPGIEDGWIIGHKVYRGRTTDNMPLLGSVGIDEDFFKDLGVVNGEAYYYSVSAINNAGEGAPSEPKLVIPFGLPSEPLGLDATTGDGTVVLSWDPPVDTGGLDIVGYQVHRAVGAGGLGQYRTLGDVVTFTDPDVERGLEYTYAVSAFTAAGNSGMSATLTITAEGTPDMPSSFSVEAFDERAVLHWGPPTNDGGREIEGYQILRGTEPGSIVFYAQVGAGETDYVDDGLVNGAQYFYRMVAFNVHGTGKATTILKVVPVGLPGPPTDLKSNPSNGSVTLTWSPSDGGGSPITSYRIYMGTSRDDLSLFTELGDVTTYVDTDLTNGVTLYYAVTGVNDVGEGWKSTIISTTPYDVPGAPTDLTAENDPGGALLKWEGPAYKGGATNLTYRILRGGSPNALTPLDEVDNATSYLDTTVSAREEYYYAVRAVNPIGDPSERTPWVRITVILGPGPVTGASAVRGDGQVLLSWSPPVDDGGAPVTGFVVFRGPTEALMVEVARPGNVLNFTDRSLENGRTYFYSIAAINSVGPGAWSNVVNVTPISVPGAPRGLQVRYTGGNTELEWLAPEAGDAAPVTGYRVYRRAEGEALELLVEIGPVLAHIDRTVDTGTVYYYSVSAVSEVGEGPMGPTKDVSTGPGSSLTWLLMALILLGAVVVGAVVWNRRTSSMTGGLGVPLAAGLEGGPEPTNIVEEVYLVYRDGRLIASCSREDCSTQDADLTSSMLIAIQGMVQEGLERGGELESIKSGDNIVMMERGAHLNLAVVVYGRPDDELWEELETTIARIEGAYAGVVEDWTGELSVFEGVDDILGELMEGTSHLTRKNLDAAKAHHQVALLSALDLYRGYVRLKVAAMNATPVSVSDATIEVRYDPTILRLERVEPDTFTLRGDSVELGTMRSGEAGTVSFLFDPLICQVTRIDGTISYRDSRGELRRTDMKQRQAEVVCPLFLTKEHTSTATLLRLISEELDKTDDRVFRYPSNLGSRQMLQAGKLAQGGGNVQLVREYEENGPPYEAEVWYYGETKVKGHKVVMRLRVLAEDRLLEFFAASSSMEPVTGVLAEFRRDLIDVLREKYRTEDIEEVGRGEEVRRSLEERDLLIH